MKKFVVNYADLRLYESKAPTISRTLYISKNSLDHFLNRPRPVINQDNNITFWNKVKSSINE